MTNNQISLTRWRNAIIASFALGGITVSSWGPRLPAIRTELAAGTGAIGLVLACSTVGAIGGLLSARSILHRLGSPRSLLVSMMMIAAALVVMAGGIALRSVPVLAVGFVVVGVGLSSLDVAINVEGSAIEREARRTLLPLMHAAWSAGVAVGAAAGAACALAGIEPAVQFAGLAVLLGMAGLIIPRSVPATTVVRRETRAMARDPWRTRFRHWLLGWTNLRLLVIGIVLLGVEFGEGSANSWLSLAAKQNHGQSGAIAALLLTLFAACEMTARLVAGPLVDRFGRVAAIRFTVTLGIAGVALFIVGNAVWILMIGIALWAAGVSMGFPLGLSAAAEAGNDPAAQVSVAASIGYLAGLIGPPLVGFLAESFGLLGALWSIAALFLAALAGAPALRKTNPPTQQSVTAA